MRKKKKYAKNTDESSVLSSPPNGPHFLANSKVFKGAAAYLLVPLHNTLVLVAGHLPQKATPPYHQYALNLFTLEGITEKISNSNEAPSDPQPKPDPDP
jgi:hypothetical protein